MPTWVSRTITWLVALIVGVVYGMAGTIAHAFRLGWFPLGVLLALIGTAALLVAVRALTADRLAALATGIGVLITAVVLSGRGPGGSVVVPEGDAVMVGPVHLGLVWLIGCAIVAVLVVVWPTPRRWAAEH